MIEGVVMIPESEAVVDNRSVTQLLRALISHDCDAGDTDISRARNRRRVQKRTARAYEILVGEDAAAKEVCAGRSSGCDVYRCFALLCATQ